MGDGRTDYYVAIGSNLAHRGFKTPLAVALAAVTALAAEETVAAVSAWYASDPEPPMPGQGRFVNAVVRLRSRRTPRELLANLNRLERQFGRVRSEMKNEARSLDLDIIAAENGGVAVTSASPTIPHPRLESRAFVLLPLAELAPNWRHPISKKSLTLLIKELPSGNAPERLARPARDRMRRIPPHLID